MKKKAFGKKSGQGSVEYILIIAVIVGVVMMFGKQFSKRLEGVTGKMFDGADKNVGALTSGS